jgi:hypothetical protein
MGLAPAIIKKSKPFARYVGDHLIKAGEYIKHGMEDDPIRETVAAQPTVTDVVELIDENPSDGQSSEVPGEDGPLVDEVVEPEP